MNVPTPRHAGDAAGAPDVEDPARERWLAAAALIYDRAREGSRMQLDHAVAMLEREMGGTVWVHIPSRPSKRSLPEAGFASELPAGVPVR